MSFFATHNFLIEGLIVALFLVGGAVGAIWFVWHIKRGIPK